MRKNKTIKRIFASSLALTITLSTLVLSPTDIFASEEHRLEFFNQLADKVTSLYYKEAVVGLHILEDVYRDEELVKNIEKRLDEDKKTKEYLEKLGFDMEKIREIVKFTGEFFPSIEEMKSESDDNIIKRLIKTTLVEENQTLSFSDYDEDIQNFVGELYEILPYGVHDEFDKHFESTEEKAEALLKILIEFIYSGHGKSLYNEKTKAYINLKLVTKDSLIKDVNKSLGVEILNRENKKAIDLFLKALEETIKSKELDGIYSDLSSVLNLVDTNYDSEKREEDVKDLDEELEEKDISRAEILKLTLTALKLEPIDYKGEFTDVLADDFYAGYIARGKSIGIISGYEDNSFKPNDKVTISEALSIISNAVDYLHGKSEINAEEIDVLLKNFTYSSNIELWVRPDVAKLVKLGVLEKDYKKDFGIDIFISRDEAMSIIDKIEHFK